MRIVETLRDWRDELAEPLEVPVSSGADEAFNNRVRGSYLKDLQVLHHMVEITKQEEELSKAA
jgi:hypothetical protein